MITLLDSTECPERHTRTRKWSVVRISSVLVILILFACPLTLMGQPDDSGSLNVEETATSAPIMDGSVAFLVQATLRSLGYSNTPLDGQIGYTTVIAVTDFQTKIGVDPSGMITHSLLRALAEAVERNRSECDTLPTAEKEHRYAESTEAAKEYSTSSAQPRKKAAAPKRRQYSTSRSRKNCCKTCKSGKACGNSCISRSKTCDKPPGCACNG